MERPDLTRRWCGCKQKRYLFHINDTWRELINVGNEGFVDLRCCSQTLVDFQLVYLGGFGFMAHWFFSLSRHFSWSPPLPPQSIHKFGWSYSMLRVGKKLWCLNRAGRQERDALLNLNQWNIDHEESAILLASCWIVQYLCKIARQNSSWKVYINIYFSS